MAASNEKPPPLSQRGLKSTVQYVLADGPSKQKLDRLKPDAVSQESLASYEYAYLAT